jgi:hypothetical protein
MAAGSGAGDVGADRILNHGVGAKRLVRRRDDGSVQRMALPLEKVVSASNCIAVAAIAGTIVLAGAGLNPALAAKTCVGTMQSTSIAPLPAPLDVGMQVENDAAGSGAAMSGFLDGMRQSGITVGGTPNTTLQLTFSVTAPPASPGAGGAVLNVGSYTGFSWLGSNDPAAPPPVIDGATLTVSVNALDNAAATISWLETVNCRITTNDAASLAHDLGSLIGGSIGKSYDNHAF